VQNRYSFADREWDYVVDYCERNGIAFIPWFPLGAGKVAGEVLNLIAEAHDASPTQVALAWLLHRSPLCCPSQGLPRSNISSRMLRGLPCAWLMKTTKHFPGFPRWPHRGERVLTSSHFCRGFPRRRQRSLVSSAPSSRMPTDCRRSDLGFRPAGRVGFVQEPEVHCPAQPLTPMKKAGFYSANRGA